MASAPSAHLTATDNPARHSGSEQLGASSMMNLIWAHPAPSSRTVNCDVFKIHAHIYQVQVSCFSSSVSFFLVFLRSRASFLLSLVGYLTKAPNDLIKIVGVKFIVD
jgi:hypothetical protein